MNVTMPAFPAPTQRAAQAEAPPPPAVGAPKGAPAAAQDALESLKPGESASAPIERPQEAPPPPPARTQNYVAFDSDAADERARAPEAQDAETAPREETREAAPERRNEESRKAAEAQQRASGALGGSGTAQATYAAVQKLIAGVPA